MLPSVRAPALLFSSESIGRFTLVGLLESVSLRERDCHRRRVRGARLGGQPRVRIGCVCAPIAARCRYLITPRNARDATPRHSSPFRSTCMIGDLGPVEGA